MSDLVIETKKLTKDLREQTAVNSVNLHVKPGQIYGLLSLQQGDKTTIIENDFGPYTTQSLPAKWMCSDRTSKAMKRIYPRIGAIIKLPVLSRIWPAQKTLKFCEVAGAPATAQCRQNAELLGLPYKGQSCSVSIPLGMKQRLHYCQPYSA